MSEPFDFDTVVAKEVSEADVARAPRGTGGITAVAVIALALGTLGLLSGLGGAMGLVVGREMQSMFSPAASGGGGAKQREMVEIQKEMAGAMSELNRRYMWFHVSNLVVQVAICIALLVGGIMTILMKPAGRKLLLTSCCAALVLEILRAVPSFLLQLQALAINRRFTERLMGSMGGPNMPNSGQFGDMMGTVMSVVSIVAMVFAFTWVLTKVIYYAFSIRYLRKPHVVERFS